VSAAASSAASETALAQHAADVDREAAAFFAGTGDLRSAALLKEKALVHELALDKVENRESAYTGLAQTFEAAGDHRKAAEYYQKLADLLAATRGRYHSLTAAANRNYKRNLSQAQRSGSTL
jgi:tetratricopeptide (TPR) repeat protein